MQSAIDKRLKEIVTADNDAYLSLFEGAQYSLLQGGKRMRPKLTLTVATALGAPLEVALDPACAVEMVHAYSLIHDDLPAMDNDDFRRGIPTLHKAFDEATAILVGDFLLTKAFEVVAHAPHLSACQKIQMVQELSSNSGSNGMIGGQLIDISSTGKKISYDQLILMHQLKTAHLLVASIALGAIAAEADNSILATLKLFAKKIGLAFQIQDDILDVTSGVEKHGLKGGSDSQNNKATFVTLLGLNEAKRQLDEQYEGAFTSLQDLPKVKEALEELFSPIFQTS